MNPKKFNDWLIKNGAEVLPPTNPYELSRFIARGGTHVIYHGRRGISAIGFAKECLGAFQEGRDISMGFARRGNSMSRAKAAIVQRDGRACFYCARELSDAEITIEHLVSRQKGGPDHQDNLAIACHPCNLKAGHLPLVQKLKLRKS